MKFIYVLQLENGNFYVGATNTPLRRIKTHFEGKGPQWTQVNKPIDIYEVKTNCDNYSEQNTTLDYMKIYGVENVRGGQYTNCQLKKYELQHVNKSINSTDDKCYKCREKGHYIDKCPISILYNNIDKLHITYDKNNKAKCFICESLINKNELKIVKHYLYYNKDSYKWAHYQCYIKSIGDDNMYDLYGFAKKNDKIKCGTCSDITNKHKLRFGYETYSKSLENKKRHHVRCVFKCDDIAYDIDELILYYVKGDYNHNIICDEYQPNNCELVHTNKIITSTTNDIYISSSILLF